MSILNTKIKPFKSIAFQQGEFIEVTHETIQGKWCVFFFYPANFTFVCPTELKELSEHYTNFKSQNIQIYAISTDTHFAHKVWYETSKSISQFQYPMIGDHNRIISKNFGVLREDQGIAERASFIIDDKSVIQSIEITADGVGRNAKELLRKVEAAKYVAENPGYVCPANWQQGSKTLHVSTKNVGKI